MSCAVASFFRSQVRDVPPPENGSTLNPPAPDTCALTSENVTSNAFASLNGESFNMTLRVEPAFDGPDGDELHPSQVTATNAINSARHIRRINDDLRGSVGAKYTPCEQRQRSFCWEPRAGSRLQSWRERAKNGIRRWPR